MVVVDDAFAWLITWTTYGSRLPGDERGYVSNTFIPDEGYHRKQNTPGTPYTADHEPSRKRARELQKWESVRLDAEEAFRVAQSLITAAQRRGWRIPRAAIMADHAHVVVLNGPIDGPAVRRILKGNAYAALRDYHGESWRCWATGGSDRQKRGEEAILAAIQYVADQEYKLAEIIDNQALRCAAK